MHFKNREEAALLLSRQMSQYKNTDSVILAVPRGGVPVGYVLARELGLPLDVILAKKIGHPSNSEYAIGSVTIDDIILGDPSDATDAYFLGESARIRKELQKKYQLFRSGKAPMTLSGKTVILTDDGIATGKTLEACVESVRKKNPLKIVVAVPVSAPDTAAHFRNRVDEFICLYEPPGFRGVGQFYADFCQVNDEEVCRLLKKAG